MTRLWLLVDSQSVQPLSLYAESCLISEDVLRYMHDDTEGPNMTHSVVIITVARCLACRCCTTFAHVLRRHKSHPTEMLPGQQLLHLIVFALKPTK